jgi:hypothetical protein
MKEIKNLLKVKNKTKVLLNNKYTCVINDEKPFLTFLKQDNCLSYHSYTIAKIDNTSFKEYDNFATISINLNPDLSYEYSAFLCLYNFNGKLVSMISITEFEFLDE